MKSTVAQAKKFLGLLREDISSPSICADADGEIAFEWYNKPYVISVSISPNGRLSWSSKVSSGNYCGEFWLEDVIPLDLIDKIVGVSYANYTTV
jgi:hypothetical protein